jgi:hypothetical protein
MAAVVSGDMVCRATAYRVPTRSKAVVSFSPKFLKPHIVTSRKPDTPMPGLVISSHVLNKVIPNLQNLLSGAALRQDSLIRFVLNSTADHHGLKCFPTFLCSNQQRLLGPHPIGALHLATYGMSKQYFNSHFISLS